MICLSPIDAVPGPIYSLFAPVRIAGLQAAVILLLLLVLQTLVFLTASEALGLASLSGLASAFNRHSERMV